VVLAAAAPPCSGWPPLREPPTTLSPHRTRRTKKRENRELERERRRRGRMRKEK